MMADGSLKLYIGHQEIRKDQGRDHTVIGEMRLLRLLEQNGEKQQKIGQNGNI